MDWTDWYTDTADVFRNEKVTENSLTHMERSRCFPVLPAGSIRQSPAGCR